MPLWQPLWMLAFGFFLNGGEVGGAVCCPRRRRPAVVTPPGRRWGPGSRVGCCWDGRAAMQGEHTRVRQALLGCVPATPERERWREGGREMERVQGRAISQAAQICAARQQAQTQALFAALGCAGLPPSSRLALCPPPAQMGRARQGPLGRLRWRLQGWPARRRTRTLSWRMMKVGGGAGVCLWVGTVSGDCGWVGEWCAWVGGWVGWSVGGLGRACFAGRRGIRALFSCEGGRAYLIVVGRVGDWVCGVGRALCLGGRSWCWEAAGRRVVAGVVRLGPRHEGESTCCAHPVGPHALAYGTSRPARRQPRQRPPRLFFNCPPCPPAAPCT